jgi:hypothetical protein
MAITDNEMKSLRREHEAIRMQMKFLTDLLIGLSAQSTPVKDLLWRYRLNLWDFQEMVRRHAILNERIFKVMVDSDLIAHLKSEHEEIRKQIDGAIQLADTAVGSEIGQGELEQYKVAVRGAVNRLCELIIAHMAKEDKLLK